MVRMYGIARGLEGQEHLGCVSQMALFVRRDFWLVTETPMAAADDLLPSDLSCMDLSDSDLDSVYKLVYKVEIPAARDGRTRNQRILDDGNYQLNFLRSQEERFYNSRKGVLEIPLQMVFEYITGEKAYDVAELRYFR